MLINPLHSKFIQMEQKLIFIFLLQFLIIDMTQIFEIFPQVRPEQTDST